MGITSRFSKLEGLLGFALGGRGSIPPPIRTLLQEHRAHGITRARMGAFLGSDTFQKVKNDPLRLAMGLVRYVPQKGSGNKMSYVRRRFLNFYEDQERKEMARRLGLLETSSWNAINDFIWHNEDQAFETLIQAYHLPKETSWEEFWDMDHRRRRAKMLGLPGIPSEDELAETRIRLERMKRAVDAGLPEMASEESIRVVEKDNYRRKRAQALDLPETAIDEEIRDAEAEEARRKLASMAGLPKETPFDAILVAELTELLGDQDVEPAVRRELEAWLDRINPLKRPKA